LSRARRRSWAEGRLDEDDLAADGFLQCLQTVLQRLCARESGAKLLAPEGP
jgi:hypothetical protein